MKREPTIAELRALANDVSKNVDHLMRFFQMARDAMVIWDRSCVAYVNPAWTEMLGYSREESVGKHWSSFVCPGVKEAREEYERVWQEMGDEGGQAAPVCYLHKEGHPVMIEWSWRGNGILGQAYAVGRRLGARGVDVNGTPPPCMKGINE